MAIPVKSVDWMIKALVNGKLPDPIPIQAPPQEPSEPQDAALDRRPDEGESAQPAEAPEDCGAALVEDSESFGAMPLEIRPSAASISFGGAAAAGQFCALCALRQMSFTTPKMRSFL